ncbi:MAG TPA: hypothetical protein VFR81_25635 [Longimicrobium sp.]|nr:hypothetical protein [Longimicrobium sp.]
MTRAIRGARTSLFALAVAGALGFGASTAVARQPPCPELAFGKCSSQDQCQRICAGSGFAMAARGCDNGCCYCVF